MSFVGCRKGGVALIMGLASPVLFGLVSVAIDYAAWARQNTLLQTAADGAALAAAREMQIGAPTASRLQSIAESVVISRVRPEDREQPISVQATAGRSANTATSAASSSPSPPPNEVTVKLYQRKAAIMALIVTPELTDVEVVSKARLMGGTRVCVVSLDETAPSTMWMDNSALISASDCSVRVNSNSASGLKADGASKITAMEICAVGGYAGSSSRFWPNQPFTGCPKTGDPLIDRPQPAFADCPKKPLKIKKQTVTLYPGTYCGGLYIQNGANVTLSPGIYIIKDGPLVIGPGKPGSNKGDNNEDNDDDGTPASKGSVIGSGVGFYFTGTVTPNTSGQLIGMRFEQNSSVSLTAPTTGPMAGLLFSEDRANSPDRRYEILSDGARRLVGTIYLSRGVFEVSANQTVADQSEYTAIVAKRIELFQAPNLVLNTRYGSTNVPVPYGLGPNSGVQLTK